MAKEKPAIQPLMEQLKTAHKQLRTLEEANTFDEAKVRALAAQNTTLVTELVVQKARIKNELYQVLTPEQKAKLSKFMERHEQRFQKHMEDDAPDSAPPAS